jgi:curved DNA-binding protein CbpA
MKDEEQEDATDAAARLLQRKLRSNQERELYSFLNVQKSASPEEIRAAYLRVASSYHPDRVTPSLRADSEAQFLKVDRAYKVLTDPLMRQAYDHLGERGLRLLQAVPAHELLPMRFPLEVAYILEELSAEEMQYAALSAQNSSGTITVHMEVPRPLQTPRLKQLSVEQQVEVSLTGATSLFGGLYVVNRKAVGMGMGYIGTRLQLGKGTWVSGTYVLSQKRKVTIETSRELSRSVNVRASLSGAESGNIGLKLASSRRLSASLMGNADLAVGTGEDEALGFGLTSSNGKRELTGRLRVSDSEVALKGIYENRISNTVQVKCVGKVGTRGLECMLGATRNLSSLTAVNFGLSVALDGVTVSIKARKGRQHIYIPIKISARLDPWSVLVGSVLNAGLNAGLVLLVRPVEKARVQRQLRMLEKELVEKQARERRNAAAQVRLMAEAAQRKAAAEKTAMKGLGGLVILEGRYGTSALPHQRPPDSDWYLPSREQDHNLDMASALDVRIPLQFFVNKSRLYLPAGSKAGMLGFYDVVANPTWLLHASTSADNDAGHGKSTAATFRAPIRPPHHRRKSRRDRPRLYVRYSYLGKVYEVTVDDIESVDLPPLDSSHTCLGLEGDVE